MKNKVVLKIGSAFFAVLLLTTILLAGTPTQSVYAKALFGVIDPSNAYQIGIMDISGETPLTTVLVTGRSAENQNQTWTWHTGDASAPGGAIYSNLYWQGAITVSANSETHTFAPSCPTSVALIDFNKNDYTCAPASALKAPAETNSETSFIPMVTTQFPGVEPDKYHVYISNGGGAAHPVVLDTGSQVMVVPKQYVGPQAQAVTPTQCHSISYGDGLTWCGRYYTGPVAIGVPENYTPGQGTYPTTQASFPFLVADPNDSVCLAQLSGCKMPSDLTNRGIMGIGFGQGPYGPAYNALLQLEGEANGKMKPGYIIQLGNATPGVTVGLTPTNMQGFGFVQLSASTLYPGQWDPNSFTGCVRLSSSSNSAAFNQCANMLFDTGTIDFTLKTPLADKPLLDPGTTVSVTGPGADPVISYTYQSTTNTTWPLYQSSVSWMDREKGVCFLIGQYIFMQYDYLFDPTAGRIGFKPVRGE